MGMINYHPGETRLFRLNPLIKGFAILGLISFFSMHSWPLYMTIGFFLLVLLTAWAGEIPLVPIWQSFRNIWFLLFIVAFANIYRDFGTAGCIAALDSILRISGVFFCAGIFVTISSQSELTFFWETCLKPFGIFGLPSREIALVMVIAIRFLPVILSEIERIKIAQMARGADFGKTGGFVFGAVRLMPLLVPVIMSAIQRASDLAVAMETRGYRLSGNRTRLNEFSLRAFDLFFAVSLGFTLVVLFLNPAWPEFLTISKCCCK